MFFNEVAPNDGHRQNILNTNYHHIGIGCIVNNSDRRLLVDTRLR